jgi:hypothetical protein
MIRSRRFVAAAGVASALAAIMVAWLVDSKIWFYDGVVEGSLAVSASIVLVIVIAEFVGHYFRGPFMRAWLLVVVATAAAVPNFYLHYAAIYGSDRAALQAWNLLPFFVLFHQVRAVTVIGVLLGSTCLLYLGGRRLMSTEAD